MGGAPRAADAPPLSRFMAIVAIVKSMIGAGVLGLPSAYGNVGFAISIPGSVFIAIINAIGVWQMLQTKHHMVRNNKNIPADATSSEESVEDSPIIKDESPAQDRGMDMKDFGLGPIAVVANQLLGRLGLALAYFGVLGTQAGLCLAYVVTIHVTLTEMPWFMDQDEIVLRIGACVVFCLLTLIRKLSSLAILSVGALIVYIFVIGDLIVRGLPEIQNKTYMTFGEAMPIHLEHLESYFGTSVFAFEGIVIALYSCDDMKLGESIRPFKGVLRWAYFISWSVFSFVGVWGYLAYGDTVKNPFYLSFPHGALDVVLDKTCLVLVLFLSFALQAFPIFSAFDYILIKQQHAGDDIVSDVGISDSDDEATLPVHRKGKRILDIILRFGTTVILCALGAGLPKIGCITDLVGAVFMSLIAFLLPGIFHLVEFKRELTTVAIVIDIILVLIGTAAITLGLKEAPVCFTAGD